jgi:hypothetical protein
MCVIIIYRSISMNGQKREKDERHEHEENPKDRNARDLGDDTESGRGGWSEGYGSSGQRSMDIGASGYASSGGSSRSRGGYEEGYESGLGGFGGSSVVGDYGSGGSSFGGPGRQEWSGRDFGEDYESGHGRSRSHRRRNRHENYSSVKRRWRDVYETRGRYDRPGDEEDLE